MRSIREREREREYFLLSKIVVSIGPFIHTHMYTWGYIENIYKSK
jgi:hypothetical protein